MNQPWVCIHVIGVDDSGAEGLPQEERRLVEAADLLCGGRRHLALFPEGRAERIPIGGDLEPLYRVLSAAPGRRRAVVLASGDPCYFGIGPLLAERLGRARVRIHPRAGSVAMAFARLGLAWQDATVLSVHGRPIDDAVRTALTADTIAFLTDPDHTPAAVARALLDAGMEDCPAYVCERLGGPVEQIHALSLSDLPGRIFDPLNVLVLLRTRAAVPQTAFGRPDASYCQVRGQITKAEVRAVALSRLEPWRARVAWDVGAGSGSVAIEIAGLMRGGTVAAVERDPEQIEALRANVRAHGAAGVRVVEGSAPDVLTSLPDPDAVFVGGGGVAMRSILHGCAARLRPGGLLVANLTLIESLSAWKSVADELGWPSEVSQIAVARGTALGSGTHLAALSPVFVTRLVRPEEQ